MSGLIRTPYPLGFQSRSAENLVFTASTFLIVCLFYFWMLLEGGSQVGESEVSPLLVYFSLNRRYRGGGFNGWQSRCVGRKATRGSWGKNRGTAGAWSETISLPLFCAKPPRPAVRRTRSVEMLGRCPMVRCRNENGELCGKFLEMCSIGEDQTRGFSTLRYWRGCDCEEMSVSKYWFSDGTWRKMVAKVARRDFSASGRFPVVRSIFYREFAVKVPFLRLGFLFLTPIYCWLVDLCAHYTLATGSRGQANVAEIVIPTNNYAIVLVLSDTLARILRLPLLYG